MGTFLAALISQRGQRFREMAVSVAKQGAELLIQHRSSFMRSMGDESILSLAANRESRSKLDPASIHVVLAGVVSGKYQSLQAGLDDINASVQPHRLLKDYCSQYDTRGLV